LEEEALRTAQLEVREKQCFSKSQHVPKFLALCFFNTPLLQHSNTPKKEVYKQSPSRGNPKPGPPDPDLYVRLA
jgi:hypothetical protein